MTNPNDSDARDLRDDTLVGQKLGKYEVVGVLGRGGMGTVYEGVNTAIGKRVALKLIDAELSRNKDAVARFQREAQAASLVESAHIVQLFDFGVTDDDVPFLVMELLRGEDLGHRIKRQGRLELSEALHVVAQILRGLHRAHEAGIVHRDLKPDNVFLVDRDDDASFVKILDFGVSKIQRRGEAPSRTLTRKGTVLGTPYYMAPEQAQALPDVDARADLWSVGAILYECLTGRPPHQGASYEQVIVSICTRQADDVRVHDPALPEAVAQVVTRALTRDRELRWGSAREMLDGLFSASNGVVSLPGGRISGAAVRTADSGARAQVARTPRPSDAELAPTLEAGTSRVGWATSGGGGERGRRRLAAIAASAGILAALAGFALVRPGSTTSAARETPTRPELAEVRLVSNAPGARFSVDGAPLEHGTLRGPVGAVRRVRVEAEGHAPLERDVTIEPAASPLAIQLELLPVPSASAEAPSPEPTATPTKAPAARTPTNSASGATGKGPAARASGVASGLQLKEE